LQIPFQIFPHPEQVSKLLVGKIVYYSGKE
jgi:hypothetical protein